MKLDVTTGKIHIGAEELISTVMRGISPLHATAEEMGTPGAHLDFEAGGAAFRLVSDSATDGEFSANYTYSVKSTSAKPSTEERSYARGVCFLKALISASAGSEKSVSRDSGKLYKINVTYVSTRSGATQTATELVTANKLLEFFEKCKSALPHSGRAEIDRVTKRMPSMKNAKFPYKNVREGQRDFIKAAYRIIAKGAELLATAPTGTGKTVSALFPAVRAIGEGKCKKAFYLTPKATTAAAAKEAIEKMVESGAQIRAVTLTAKEKLCRNGLLCIDGRELCSANEEKRVRDAAMALYDEGLSVVTPTEVSRIAKDFDVCPHELSLTYSELCDVIICDFNYLFDPKVYLRRYFEEGGSYSLLIDEAHNLPERIRETYSAELSYGDLLSPELSEVFGEYSPVPAITKKTAEDFKALLFPYVKDELRESSSGETEGAYHSKSAPEGLEALLENTATELKKELLRVLGAKDAEQRKRKRLLKDYIYRIESFLSIYKIFDDGFEFFLFSKKEELRAKLFCLDTGKVIKEKTEKNGSSVFFSATLAPADYYKGVLGVSSSAELLNVDSPFAKEQLAVAIIESINTRYSGRDESIFSVCRAIAAALSSKRGHYIIFAPSYEYTKRLYDAFTAKYPKINSICQRADMTDEERRLFLEEFSKDSDKYLAAFCVMGGIYSEGIDLSGDKLIGAIVVGIGIPAPSYEREAVAAYYDELCESGKLYSYIYPGMNKVLQAAGRVIRSEDDRGTILLIDDRFRDPKYKKSAPALWGKLHFFDNPKALKEYFESFWNE